MLTLANLDFIEFASPVSAPGLRMHAAESGLANAPTSPGEIAQTMLLTLAQIWEGFVGHVPYLGGSCLVLLLTWLLAHLVDSFGHRLFGRSRMRKSLRDLLVRLLTIGVWVLGLLFAAMVLFPGLTPTRALGGLGIASVAVGLAFKDVFENFFAGILLLWRFPFEEEDFISCGDVMGKVVTVAVRNTTIRRPSGELVVVPNSYLFKNPCDVLTDRPFRRVDIVVGVGYGEDVANAVTTIQAAVNGCESVLKDPPVEVFAQAFGASSIDIEAAWWTQPTPLDVRRSRGEVVTAIKSALDEAGIEIPFPQRTLSFAQPLATTTSESA